MHGGGAGVHGIYYKRLLTNQSRNIMIGIKLSGETGVSPVRARRREAYVLSRRPDPKPQSGEKPLEQIREGRPTEMLSRNIRTA